MNVHNSIKYGGDLLRAYSRAVGMAEDETGVERLGETLTPVIDLWDKPEFRLLRGERPFWHQQTAAAVAAERSILVLRNPAGSRLLAVVELARTVQDCTIRLSSNQAQVLDTDTQGFPRDGRLVAAGPDVRSRVRFGTMSETTANAGTTVWEMTLANDGKRIIKLDFILSPGRDLRLAGIADNTALGGGFWWRERPALPGELLGALP